jgi:hypothetical protein
MITELDSMIWISIPVRSEKPGEAMERKDRAYIV